MGDVVKNIARERVWATGVNKNGLRGFFYGLYFSNGSPKLSFFFHPFYMRFLHHFTSKSFYLFPLNCLVTKQIKFTLIHHVFLALLISLSIFFFCILIFEKKASSMLIR
jgi:hypothetical protein